MRTLRIPPKIESTEDEAKMFLLSFVFGFIIGGVVGAALWLIKRLLGWY